MKTIDLNCDLGESFGNWVLGADADVMPRVTSANVACGFHGGDPVTIDRTVALAKEHGVAVGAHPGLPDLLGFGRRRMVVSPEDAAAYVVYQVGAVKGFLDKHGVALSHVKPHGAFYTVLRDERDVADAVADALLALGSPTLLWPALRDGEALVDAARSRGLRVVGEIYPDLSYAPDGSLVIQRTKRHTDVAEAAEQVRTFVRTGAVKAEDGTDVPLEAGSICIHGDGPNALDVIDAIRAVLHDEGVEVRAPGSADA
jgi:UPF0271 protein